MGVLAVDVVETSIPKHASHGGLFDLGRGGGTIGLLSIAVVVGRERDHMLGCMTKGVTISRRGNIFLDFQQVWKGAPGVPFSVVTEDRICFADCVEYVFRSRVLGDIWMVFFAQL
jgi:hypothetical protein